MSNQKLTNEEQQSLDNAISKLSEEDQMQIAAAGVITNEQCERIQTHAHRTLCDYGGPYPRPIPPIKKYLKKAEQEQPSPLMPAGPVDITKKSDMEQ